MIERSATEVLLSVEEKLITLINQKKLEDFTNKLVLERLNKIHFLLEKAMEDPDAKQAEGVSGQPGVTQPIPEAPVPSFPPLAIETVPQGTRRTNRPQTHSEAPHSFIDSDKKVPVIQRVVDATTSKNVFMATVEITNDSRIIVEKIKTNASGKWQAQLRPGNYTVSIQKKDVVSGKLIENSQKITIDNTDSAITLPLVMITPQQ